MKTWKRLIGCAMLGLAMAATSLVWPRAAQAQDAATPTTRFYVELKDATLYDALEMLFKAGGNEPRSIDASAKGVLIGSFVRTNVDWYDAVRQLSNDNGFVVTRDQARTVHIEPRVPAATEGGAPGGFGPGGFAPGGFTVPGARPGGFAAPGAAPGGLPRNPFGATTARPLIQPTSYDEAGGNNGEGRIVIRSNAQTAPAFGGTAGSTARPGSNPDARFKIVLVQHVYVGGIAALFSNVGVISTEQFVVPASAAQGGLGGGGGFGGNGGFGGGFGGVSSFGGNRNSNTGGFGGNTGSFGGNTGGFGGSIGGFGGSIGGFGGSIGGFGVNRGF
jgi:hypothetical protein